MGVGWVREEFTASSLHHATNAPYHWSAYDRVINAEVRAHMHVLGLLDYNNTFGPADHSAMPHADIKQFSRDFARYAYRVVRHFRGRVAYWEIWNEPDYKAFWSPQPNPSDYATLLAAAGKAIRRANRRAKVVLGGTSGVDLGFIQRVAAQTRSFDIISVHPYRTYPEPSLLAQVRSLKRMHKAIWFSEIGWPTGNACSGCTTEDAQASDLVRFYTLAAAAHVDHVFWYELRDDDQDPVSREANFGLLRRDLSGKPAFVAYAYLTRLLSRARFTGAESLGKNGVFVLEFRSHREHLAVLWNTQAVPRTASLPWQSAHATLLRLDGTVLGLSNIKRGRAHVKLWPGATPVYLVDKIAEAAMLAPGPLIRIAPKPTPVPPTAQPSPHSSRSHGARTVNNGAWVVRMGNGSKSCRSASRNQVKRAACLSAKSAHKRRREKTLTKRLRKPAAAPTTTPTPIPTTSISAGPTPTP